MLVASVRLGPAGNYRAQGEDQQVLGSAAVRGGAPSEVGDLRRHDVRARAVDEDAFGMCRGESAAARRGAGLVQHRRALRRGFTQVDGIEAVKLPLMPHPM